VSGVISIFDAPTDIPLPRGSFFARARSGMIIATQTRTKERRITFLVFLLTIFYFSPVFKYFELLAIK
jgi:hypothetical protein